MTIFKAYDIRGIYPTQINEEIIYKIGRAFVLFLKCKEVVIGRDARESSPSLFKALSKGITDQGANVIEIGLSTSPMLYFAASKADAAIMLTASHNSKEYNGLKLCRKNCVPISYDTGINQIEALVKKNIFPNPLPSHKGKIQQKQVFDDFLEFNLNSLNIADIKPLKVVVDGGNGMSGLTFPTIFANLPCTFIPLYMDIDCSFPNHDADPLKLENVKDIQKAVIENNADLGIALDGDGDRCMFIDEKGDYISADLITALVSKSVLKNQPNKPVLFDLRSSKSVKEFIQQNNGKPQVCRVGHSFIKEHMRKVDAVFAGELSGHFYYKNHFFTESTIITSLTILRLISESNQTLSQLVATLKKYFHSGEINSDVNDKEKIMSHLAERFSDAQILHLDGVSGIYDNWWFNVRPSNTEPLLRLNLEADSQELMEEKKDLLLSIISS
ncbi:phosphomannomutase/phosphoglucomutase [Candidatus Woesearchaeota archaeon]|jgi:phosphomannomutase|nr:phosphomannomutase/phosphoglucomutase [Candidatus Woesearchaeota archaeon]MBT7367614.1 phosphomannomutase/phosphoglucomutase [Candidatus Woesearchaeota archaeon]